MKKFLITIVLFLSAAVCFAGESAVIENKSCQEVLDAARAYMIGTRGAAVKSATKNSVRMYEIPGNTASRVASMITPTSREINWYLSAAQAGKNVNFSVTGEIIVRNNKPGVKNQKLPVAKKIEKQIISGVKDSLNIPSVMPEN